MAINFDAPVNPDALTTFIREVPIPASLGLSSMFGRRTSDDNTVDFAEIVRTNRTARYRSYDGRLHVSERDVGSEKRVKLPPLSSSLSQGEYERLQLQFARLQGGNLDVLARSIYNDGEILTREVQNRIEQAWGDVLTDGVLSIDENGFTSSADFGIPANQIATAGTAWTNLAGATPLTNFVAWFDICVANGFRPARVLTSTRVMRLMQQNTELISAVYGATQGRTRVNQDEVNTLLASEGLPTFMTPYDGVLDVDGATVKVLADDKVIFLPANLDDLGYTVYGVSATALELVNSNRSDMSFENAAGIVGVIEKTGPPYREFTFVDAVAMPILANARNIAVWDVA